MLPEKIPHQNSKNIVFNGSITEESYVLRKVKFFNKYLLLISNIFPLSTVTDMRVEMVTAMEEDHHFIEDVVI